MKSESASWMARSSSSSELVSTHVLVSSAWRLTQRAYTETAPTTVARIRRMIGKVRRLPTGALSGVSLIRGLLSSFRFRSVFRVLGAGALEIGRDPYAGGYQRCSQDQP